MKPYFEQDGLTIFHGDCREILPTLKADLIVTDPPYGIALRNHSPGNRRRTASYEIAGDASLDVALHVLAWAEERAIPVCAFASPWKPLPGDWRNMLVWDKGPAVGGGGDTSLCFKRTWELIQVRRNGPLQAGRGESVLRHHVTPRDSILHPAAKPKSLMVQLVSQLSKSAEMILDPFMGSGTTLVAAQQLGRKAIGIELEEKYCEIAAKRIMQHKEQAELAYA